jgi:hypothetical protein
LKHVADVG